MKQILEPSHKDATHKFGPVVDYVSAIPSQLVDEKDNDIAS